MGAGSGADYGTSIKHPGKPPRKGSRIPAALFQKTSEELPGKLGVIGVLAKGERRVGSPRGSAGSEPLLNVGPSDIGRLGLDYKAHCITQGLSQQ